MHSTNCVLNNCTLGVVVLLAFTLGTGCDEETLGPDSRGSIEGTVLNTENDAPIPRVNVTTSPPTQSVLTGTNGRFAIKNVETGNYTLEASKTDFEPRTVAVNVQRGDTSQATILLERSDDAGPSADSLRVTVTNFYNEVVNRDNTGADSVFVHAEYEAENVGSTTITAYEVYFEIETDKSTFSLEDGGDTLKTGQSDVRRIRKYTTDERGTDVRVSGTYVESN